MRAISRRFGAPWWLALGSSFHAADGTAHLEVLLMEDKLALSYAAAHTYTGAAYIDAALRVDRRWIEFLTHGGELLRNSRRTTQKDANVALGELIANLFADPVPIRPSGVLVVPLAGGDILEVELAGKVSVEIEELT